MAYLINLETHTDERGSLTVIEKILPFEIKRIFYLDKLGDIPRGSHKHHELYEAIVCLRGKFVMEIRNKKREDFFLLDSSQKCLLVLPDDFRILHSFSKDCLILVLASCEYNPQDYIYEVK